MIRIANLGKRYRLVNSADSRVPYRRLSEDLSGLAARAISRVSSLRPRGLAPRREAEYFWALRQFDCEISRGEVVGVIGRNGAGKSTLLKLLSRITEPTEGRIDLDGRIASLLEVGTGFHPELTGRENVFLNGAVLGMSSREIRRKFDEIVAFAEVEKFLDTPVKRYSSGMYVRLAFAVAAHLEPEILVVDEVLAVGDVAFQRKCLGKMGDVSRGGRTVLFVSHNMSAVQRLCSRCVLLDAGRILFDGAAAAASAKYSELVTRQAGQFSTENYSLAILDEAGTPTSTLLWSVGQTLVLRLSLRSEAITSGLAVDLAFYTDEGVRVFSVQSDRFLETPHAAGHQEATFAIELGYIPLACDLTVDIGVRERGGRDYQALWKDACRVVVDVASTTQASSANSLFVPTCHVTCEPISIGLESVALKGSPPVN